MSFPWIIALILAGGLLIAVLIGLYQRGKRKAAEEARDAYRRELDAARVKMDSYMREISKLNKTIEARQENAKEASGAKKKVDESPDADLADRANSLFNGKPGRV